MERNYMFFWHLASIHHHIRSNEKKKESIIFIDDLTAAQSSRKDSGVYRDVLSAHIQPIAAKLIGQFR